MACLWDEGRGIVRNGNSSEGDGKVSSGFFQGGMAPSLGMCKGGVIMDGWESNVECWIAFLVFHRFKAGSL